MSDIKLLYPKLYPLSVNKILLLFLILFITFDISYGDKNCPFFTLTGFFVLAAATNKSVCLHKKAGI